MLPEGWSARSLGSVLERVVKPVTPSPAALYREIGIRSHGKGIFHKPPVLGESLGDKRVFEVVPDCLVLNIVFAWEQAVARTTEAEVGMIASHRFPMFRPRGGACNIDFLTYFFKSKRGKSLLELASPGGAGRNKTLGQDDFSKLTLQMPTAAEQARIASLLATWDAAIEVAQGLLENNKALKRSLIAHVLNGTNTNGVGNQRWKKVRLGELAKLNPKNEALSSGTKVSFVPMNAVTDEGQLIRMDEALYEDVATGYTSFKNNDVLVAKITPCFENGKGALIRGLTTVVGYGSTEFHVIRAKDQWSAKFIYHVICSARFRALGRLNMQGSAGQKRVPTDFLRDYKFYIPYSRDEQIQVAEALDLCDSMFQSIQTNLRNLRRQRQGLMQQLLTGKRRVKPEPKA